MLNNNYRRGSEAHFMMEEFIKPMNKLEQVIDDQVDAYQTATDELEDAKQQIDDYEQEVDNLEEQVKELTERLHEAAQPIPNRDEEFLRVLRNISVYVNDSIKTLEVRCGYEEQNNTSGSGDQCDASPEDLGYEADK